MPSSSAELLAKTSVAKLLKGSLAYYPGSAITEQELFHFFWELSKEERVGDLARLSFVSRNGRISEETLERILAGLRTWKITRQPESNPIEQPIDLPEDIKNRLKRLAFFLESEEPEHHRALEHTYRELADRLASYLKASKREDPA